MEITILAISAGGISLSQPDRSFAVLYEVMRLTSFHLVAQRLPKILFLPSLACMMMHPVACSKILTLN
jgi:hypothetical protein